MTSPDPNIKSQLAESIVQNTHFSFNVGGRIITTTEDKVRLAVHDHLERMEHKRGWIGPAGILLTLVLALVTSDFRDALNVAAADWRALFRVLAFVSGIWLLVAIRRAVNVPTMDAFVNALHAPQDFEIDEQLVTASSSQETRNGPRPQWRNVFLSRSERTGQVDPPWPPGDLTSANRAPRTDWEQFLLNRVWILTYNPGLGRSKKITFLASGAIGEGQNKNEHRWRIQAGKLEILQSDGATHSRFAFERESRRFTHTNDADTHSLKDQYITLLTQ